MRQEAYDQKVCVCFPRVPLCTLVGLCKEGLHHINQITKHHARSCLTITVLGNVKWNRHGVQPHCTREVVGRRVCLDLPAA